MRKTLRVLGWVTAVIVVIIAVLRLTVLDWWTIPSDEPASAASLAPNLFAGDFVLLYRGAPKYGDLVRCADPEAPGRYVVGRMLAEPGDTIELSNTDIIVNGRKSLYEMACFESKFSIPHPATGSPEELFCGIEAMQGHKHHRAVKVGVPSVVGRKATVSEGNVFLVSDNRAFPMDSRDYGAVPKSSCKESVFFRMWGTKGAGDQQSRFVYIR